MDYSTGVPLTGQSPYLHIAGSNNNGGAFNSYGLDSPLAPAPIYSHPNSNRANYSHDVTSMLVFDARKDSQCVNANEHCDVLFDFNENDVRLWDKTDSDQPVELSRTTYPEASYVHSGWWTEDRQVLVVHDELDERDYGLNTSVRFFDISNLTRPVLLSSYTGPTHTIDHNGFVRGNRYYMSNYERGLTVLDLSDPREPTEVGFFDTYPLGNNPNFNGAWGVYPFLPSGLLLVSDINSGLYVLRDQTLNNSAGTLSFSAADYNGVEGEPLIVEVHRSDSAEGAVSMAYETHSGSATVDDFAMTSGRLHWADGEAGSQSFTVEIHNDTDEEELEESVFLRLFDPRGGASLAVPNLAQGLIAGRPNPGSVGFDRKTLSVQATDAPVEFSLLRRGGDAGAITVGLEVDPDIETLFSLSPQILSWADGDSAPKNVRLIPSGAGADEDRSGVIRLTEENRPPGSPDILPDALPDTLEVILHGEEPQSPRTPPTGPKSSGGGSATVVFLLLLALLCPGTSRLARGPDECHRSRLQQS